VTNKSDIKTYPYERPRARRVPLMQPTVSNPLSSNIALSNSARVGQCRKTSQNIAAWCPGRESCATTDTTNHCLSLVWRRERLALVTEVRYTPVVAAPSSDRRGGLTGEANGCGGTQPSELALSRSGLVLLSQ
jgi:hypothetical protein